MGMAHIFVRDDLQQPLFDLLRGFAGGEPQPVADAEDMGVDRHRVLAESHVEHHVGGLAADAGQLDERFAVVRHLSVMVADQGLRQRDDVPGLAAPQADGADIVADAGFAEFEHLLRRVGDREQGPGRLVDAGVGRLRRQHDRHQKGEDVDVFQFALRLRALDGEAAENLVHLGLAVA